MEREEVFQKKFSIIKEVAGIIVSTNNLDCIANLILDIVLQSTRARTGSLLLLNNEGNLLIKAARGINYDLTTTIRLKIGEGISGKVAQEKVPLLVKDIKSDGRIKSQRINKYKTSSFICCPILIKDKLLGVINITDKINGTPFTEEELDLINILATQAAMALEHARLMSELQLKALEVEEINKELVDIDRLKTAFVAKISHELRTPLNSIKGAAYYLKERKAASKVEEMEFVDIISEETNKLIALLDELALEREEKILKRKTLNLRDILQEVIATKIVKDILSARKISMKLICPDYLQDIIGDKIRILQMFINLIDGITRYATRGDTIEIKATDTESFIEVELFVKDRMIPDDELPVIFDNPILWHWPDAHQNNIKFYLVKKTLKLHKGDINIFNTSDGFIIRLTFPKSQKELRDTRIDELMNLFISFTAELMSLNKCSLMLIDELTGELIIRSAYGVDKGIIKKTRLKIGDKIAGWVVTQGKPLFIEDIEKDPQIGRKNRTQYTTKSFLCIPISVNNKSIGVLNLNNKKSGETFDKKDLYLAMAIAERISQLIEEVKRMTLKEGEFRKIIKDMELLLDAVRKYRKEKERIIGLMYKMMQYMGSKEEEIKQALYASALYDLGLTQIDERILLKPGQLSALESKIIKTHPFSGVGLIRSVETSSTIQKAILYHHERYNGSGYPEGLKGENIPFLSRVLAVVDTYTAMTTKRPYREAVDNKESLKQIRANAGTQFDPFIVNALLGVMERHL